METDPTTCSHIGTILDNSWPGSVVSYLIHRAIPSGGKEKKQKPAAVSDSISTKRRVALMRLVVVLWDLRVAPLTFYRMQNSIYMVVFSSAILFHHQHLLRNWLWLTKRLLIHTRGYFHILTMECMSGISHFKIYVYTQKVRPNVMTMTTVLQEWFSRLPDPWTGEGWTTQEWTGKPPSWEDLQALVKWFKFSLLGGIIFPENFWIQHYRCL